MNGTPRAQQDERYLAAAAVYGPMIERLARGYEADPELRRDLLQEIHTALWRSFAVFEGQCAERSWVFRIAHNTGVTHILTSRRSRKMHLTELDALAELPGSDDPESSVAER